MSSFLMVYRISLSLFEQLKGVMMKKTNKNYLTAIFFLLFLPILLFANSIKPITFTWVDGDTKNYYRYSGSKQSPLTAAIKTMTFFDAKLGSSRTINAVNEDGTSRFVYPDVYKFNSIKKKRLYTTNNGVEGSTTVKASPDTQSTWTNTARARFGSTNLNAYIGGSNQSNTTPKENALDGIEDATYPNRPTQYTVRHLLSYAEGVKVGFGGDGYVIVSERGGNNHFYILARDMDGNELGNIFIRQTPTDHCSDKNHPKNNHWGSILIDPNVDYWPSGRMQENSQEICVAIYPIQDLAAPGSTIGSIEMWAASEDPGDGKVMFYNNYQEPKLCYDYSVNEDGSTISSEDRNISVTGKSAISINVAIRSEEADFDMTNSQITVTLDPSDKVTFKKAEYSPNTTNTLIPAVYIEGNTNRPKIAIGENATESGGIIGSEERYFTKFDYEMKEDFFDGHFNIELNVTTDPTGLNPIQYLLHSDDGSLERCEQTFTYSPQWGMFNIERIDSGNFDPINQANQRFTLYTQVAGKDFDFSIVVYDANNSTPYSEELAVPYDVTVDIELIDAAAYDDNQSFFKCQNTDLNIIQQLPGGGTSILKTISSGNARADFSGDNVMGTPKALQNAAFRMWMLVDKNGTIVPHNCIDKTDNSCFKNAYDNYIVETDTSGSCATACSDNPGGENCYTCLRHYFAVAVCSRDNFSVKPASYRIAVHDTEESPLTTDPTFFIDNNEDTSTTKLAAGYLYRLEANATQWNTDAIARGYNINFKNVINADLISQMEFNDETGCDDQASKQVGVRFDDGRVSGTYNDNGNLQLHSNNLFKHSNAGKYNYHIEDQNWTLVDQKRYEYKTFPNVDDCVLQNTSVTVDSTGRHGCGISSKLSGTPNYEHMALEFKPYRFNLSGITFGSRPTNNGTHLYMNDLNKSMGMAVTLDGYITAMSKDNIALSNFTATCAAEDVNLWLNKNITHNTVSGNTITAIDGTTIISFQQALNTALSSDGNLSVLSSALFANTVDGNGTADANLSYNFAKPYASPINPVDVNFTRLNAASPDAQSNAHMLPDYTPDGNLSINQSRYFYYAKVEELAGTNNTPVYDTNTTTTLHVNGYCDLTTSLLNCSLLPGMLIDTAPWYRMTNHNPTFDGQINTLSTTTSAVVISPNTNITFDTNGTTTSIRIAYPIFGRPIYPVIVVNPDEWLKYNSDPTKNGLPEFTIPFLNEGLKWKGKGKTGHVIETEPRILPNPRMSW